MLARKGRVGEGEGINDMIAWTEREKIGLRRIRR